VSTATVTVPVTKRSPLRMIIAACMLAIGVSILAFAMRSSDAANRDYMCYWTAGQQLVRHTNPYDGAAILRLEKAYGFTGSRAALMRNPPWAFFLALPLGFLSERAGAVAWSLAIIAALMVSIRLLWIIHGRPADRLHLVGYYFPPALACLLSGQIGAFLLLGVTLFLYLHERHPYAAGAMLLLCMLKPHLFLPFGIVLLAWALTRRAYPIISGAAVALAASVAIGFLLDPHGWSHYAAAMKGESLQNEFIPTLSLMFRLAVDRQAPWLQFLPALAGIVWALWYFLKHRTHWDWMEQGSLLLLVSVMVAPYAWFTDETVVLAAIVAGLYRASNAGRSLLPFGCIAGVAVIEVLFGVITNSGFYVWTAPAWLAWYLFATRSAYPRKTQVPLIGA
jgi:hypothetical protein